MEVIHLTYPLIPAEAVAPQAMAIGYFDGLHCGHANVIEAALEIGRSQGLPVSVMTFHPHPREVLGIAPPGGLAPHSSGAVTSPDTQGVQYLTPLPVKTRLLADMGVDKLYVMSFDLPLSRISPSDFVQNVLHVLGVHTAIVGFNFTFGYQGKGTSATLKELGQGFMDVKVVEPFLMGGDKVSSTLVRQQLQQGAVERAAWLLGRPYALSGTVVTGRQIGRTIGFPTANIEPDAPYVLPMVGVYAVRAQVDGQAFDGVMNIGFKPTFDHGEIRPVLEVHLLDYEGDLYGRTLEVEFVHFIRGERKFPSIDELIAQIRKDADSVRASRLR